MTVARNGEVARVICVARDRRGELELRVERLGDRCQLTRRERQIACRIACGDTNPEITKRLKIGLGTVKSHVQHVLDKVGARGRRDVATIVWSVEIRSVGDLSAMPAMVDGTAVARKRDVTTRRPGAQGDRRAPCGPADCEATAFATVRLSVGWPMNTLPGVGSPSFADVAVATSTRATGNSLGFGERSTGVERFEFIRQFPPVAGAPGCSCSRGQTSARAPSRRSCCTPAATRSRSPLGSR